MARGQQSARHALLVALLSALGGCSADTGLAKCERLVREESYAQAAAICRREYESSRNPKAAGAAARAYYGSQAFESLFELANSLEEEPQLADVWFHAGRAYRETEQMSLARLSHSRALALYQRAGDHTGVAETLCRLAGLDALVQNFHGAQRYAETSYQEALRSQRLETRSCPLLTLLHLSWEIGEAQLAHRVLQAARPILGSLSVANQSYFKSYEGLLLAETADRPVLALEAFKEAYQLARQTKDAKLLFNVHSNLAAALLDLARFDKARQHLQEAEKYRPAGVVSFSHSFHSAKLAHAEGKWKAAIAVLRAALAQSPPPDWSRQMEELLGRSLSKLGDGKEAEAAFRRSIDAVEAMRRNLESSDLRDALLAKKRHPYEALFALQAGSQRFPEAFATAERAKARAFLDAFITATPEAKGPQGGEMLFHGDRAMDRYDGLRQLLPVLAATRVAAPRPASEVRAALGAVHLLSYFSAEGQLWLIQLARGTLRLTRLAVPLADIERLVHRFTADLDDASTAERLGSALLPPGSLPRPGRALHIVTDGVLGRLPFAALRLNGRALMQDYVLSYVPSATALAALRSAPRSNHHGARVLGDPSGDLPAAAQEAEEVAALLAAVARTGEKATSVALRSAARARVLHLAAHTGLGSQGPWLALADQRVSAASLLQWKLAPRLVVLASCASAAPPRKDMWGSLAATFLAAGSHSVLAALWSIRDDHAREFVRRFYAHGGARHPAAAVARAQQALAAAKRPAAQWAPFVVFGSLRATQ